MAYYYNNNNRNKSNRRGQNTGYDRRVINQYDQKYSTPLPPLAPVNMFAIEHDPFLQSLAPNVMFFRDERSLPPLLDKMQMAELHQRMEKEKEEEKKQKNAKPQQLEPERHELPIRRNYRYRKNKGYNR